MFCCISFGYRCKLSTERKGYVCNERLPMRPALISQVIASSYSAKISSHLRTSIVSVYSVHAPYVLTCNISVDAFRVYHKS